MAYRVESSGRGLRDQCSANSPETSAWSCCLKSKYEPFFSRTITPRAYQAGRLLNHRTTVDGERGQEVLIFEKNILRLFKQFFGNGSEHERETECEGPRPLFG